MVVPPVPDALALTRAALLAQPLVVAFVGQRVHERVPPSPTYPLLRLTVTDEYEPRPGAGAARVQVDAWAAGGSPDDHSVARRLAAAIVAATYTMPGVYPEGAITLVAPEGTTDLPDPSTARQRCFVDLTIEFEPTTEETP